MTFRRGMLAVLCGLIAGLNLARGQELATIPLASDVPVMEEFGTAPMRDERFWFRGDYLLGWFRRGTVGSLVTTSPAGTDVGSAGILGLPTTSTLFGGTVHDSLRSGFQVSVGAWLDSVPRRSVEAGFMVFENDASRFAASSSGNPILARPFLNALTNQPDAVLVAFPGIATGSIQALTESKAFYAAHVDLTEAFYETPNVRLESMVGYRYFRYAERVLVNQSVQPLNPLVVPGTTINTRDEFSTGNDFHGLDLGLRSTFTRDALSLTLLTRVAAGRTLRNVDIQGSQVTTVPGIAPVTANGGLLALSSNIGNRERNDWSVVPELGLDVGWQVNPRLRLHAGYSFLFMTRLARAADQIDFTVNETLLPGSTDPAIDIDRPAFNFRASDLWIQSLRFGFEWTF